MSTISPTCRLARIRPVSPVHASQTLSTVHLVLNSFLLIAVQSGWVVTVLAAAWVAGPLPTLGAILVAVSLVWFVLQLLLIGSYPEWPLNRLLCRRLRRNVRRRHEAAAADTSKWQSCRVVEWVPREHWQRMSFETAADLMLLRFDAAGISMAGDRNDYDLPAESIIGAELCSAKPAGWITPTHMAILTLRTDHGPIELPIAYRDHTWGSLSNRRRRDQAVDLVDRINAIAQGFSDEPPTVPHRERPPLPRRRSSNPYATPTVTS